MGMITDPPSGIQSAWLLASAQSLSPASSPGELSEFLWVDFLVDNGTSGGLAVTRPVTWQLEYPGQAPEAEKDKMVWEIPVSERDIRALVPLAKVRGAPSAQPGGGPRGAKSWGLSSSCAPRPRSW